MGKPELVAKYEAKKKTGQFKQKHPAYAAMVQSLDESVGRVLDKLEATGQAGNTIVIFTGDNGANSNKYSGGLRGSKAWSHEGGVREPFFIKGPGIQPGSTSDVPVIAIDLYPTLLDLIGAPLKPEQHKDGVSLKPLLRAEGDLPTRSLFWHYPHYHKTKPYGSIRNGEYKLIEFFEEGHLELYNIKDDMAEENNLAESMSEKAAEMLKEMQAWRISVDAQMMTPNPQYDPDHENKGRKSADQKPANPSGNAGRNMSMKMRVIC
jgi:arylsulfatase A